MKSERYSFHSSLSLPLSRLRTRVLIRQSLREIQADPFVCAVVENTCYCIDNENYEELKLDCLSHLMIEPLKKLRHEPTSVQEVQLKIVAIRFQRQYQGPDVDWESPLNTQNDLLEQVHHNEISALAESLSRADLALYRQLDIDAIPRKSDQKTWKSPILHDINTRWNCLSILVEECMAARAGID